MKKLKKAVIVLTMALLVAVMSIGLVACSKSGSIKKAFEKEGYTVTTVDKENELAKMLFDSAKEEQKAKLEKCELILVSKSLKTGLIIKFASASDLKEYVGEDNYDKAVEQGIVNGDCTLFTLDVSGDVAKIFKNA